MQGLPDAVGHRLPFEKHVAVPEAKDFESFGTKPRIAACVKHSVGRLVVLTAVELDDHAPIETDKIDDLLAEGNLPTKLESGEATASELLPDNRFRFGLRVTEVSSTVAVR